MASPFKRQCLRAVQQYSRGHLRNRAQWQNPQHYRPFSSTPSPSANTSGNLQRPNDAVADEAALHDLELPPAPSDAELDRLAKQPGVTYTSTEVAENDDWTTVDLDNLSSLAHRELEQHRELREMVRLAAWEMPLLSSLSQPFTPATPETETNHLLRWRYTTYMGETHPAQSKVVVEFRPGKIPALTDAQREKLIKLAGPRYHPTTCTVKMSCESYESQAQNKRFLADTITRLIAEAKDPQSDSFADVPRDTRHVKGKRDPKFPVEWRLTAERKAYLEERRTTRLLEEGKKVEQGQIVSGVAAIEAARKAQQEAAAAKAEAVMVEARQKGPAPSKGGRTRQR